MMPHHLIKGKNMPETAGQRSLSNKLITTWAEQARNGFLLSDPETAVIETREAADADSGVTFRFRWMPHREIRGDVSELERRGILNAERDESLLFRDPRDPNGRHCFLCEKNIRECHPLELLVPMQLAGRDYFAGANFAWIEPDHFTIMTAEHTDQVYSRHSLDAAIAFIEQTEGRFRLLFNGEGAGATIPWHFHFQVTTQPMPIESIHIERLDQYPTRVLYFEPSSTGSQTDAAHHAIDRWLGKDPQNNSVNLLLTGEEGRLRLFICPRDKRRSKAENKGLVGGFEVAGDFVLSAPKEESTFRNCSAETAKTILRQVKPEF